MECGKKWSGSGSGSRNHRPIQRLEKYVAPSGRQARRHGKGVAGEEEDGAEGRWCLAADLLEKIFSLLPVQDVIRAGAVCRWWNTVAGSSEFRKVAQSPLVQGDIYFPVFFSDQHQQSCFGFDIDSKRWRELPPITFLPGDESTTGCELVAYDKGLLCVEKGGVHYVCNPATKAYKVLPPMICCKELQDHKADLHLQVDRDGQGYSLVALCGRMITSNGGRAVWFPPPIVLLRRMNPPLARAVVIPDNQRHHLRRVRRGGPTKVTCYDSKTNSWTQVPTTSAPNGFFVVSRSVYFRGALYVLAMQSNVGVRLMCFDMARQCWHMFGAVHAFDRESKTRMVAMGNHIMVVSFHPKGFLVSSFKPPAMLESQGMEVEEVQMHELFLEEGSEFLQDCNIEGWHCVGYESSIYIVTLKTLKLAVCHVFKKTWLRLQNGSYQCARRTYRATPFSCPIEVGLRTPV